jgi:hypothetical protein
MKKITIVLAVLLFFSCNTAKRSSTAYSDYKLSFGSYGGATNSKMEYQLHSDRNVYEKNFDTLVFVRKISKSEIKNIEQTLEKTDFLNMQLNSPSNYSYFIKMENSEQKQQIVWSDPKKETVAEEIYTLLLSIIKSKK